MIRGSRMDADNDGIPAWMVAQALIVKMKNIMIEEAVGLLYREIEEKRMAVNGSFVKMSDKDGEVEQGIFLIENLMDKRSEIMADVGGAISRASARPDVLGGQQTRNIEAAKAFLKAVDEITALYTYGRVFEGWFDDASSHVHGRDPATILAATCGGVESHRAAALKFLVESRIFRESGILIDTERDIIISAVHKISE
jgi:hypothetical protein